MIDSFIVHPTVRRQLREGPFGLAIDHIAQALQTQGYAAATIKVYLSTERYVLWDKSVYEHGGEIWEAAHDCPTHATASDHEVLGATAHADARPCRTAE